MSEKRRPILIKGENYISPFTPSRTRPPKDDKPSFTEMKARLIDDIENVIRVSNSMPSGYAMEEIVINLRMNVKYSAKSFHPDALINAMGASDVGSKKWTKNIIKSNKSEVKIGKEVFVRIDKSKLKAFESKLKNTDDFNKGVIENIRCYERLMYSDNSLIMEKFEEEWREGRVELIIHPYGRDTESVKERLKELILDVNGDLSKTKMKTYDSGITFVSTVLRRDALEGIVRFNPIRTAHPLQVKSSPFIRVSDSGLPLPKLPVGSEKSNIIVGIFDGGVNSNNEYLMNYVTEYNPINTPKNDQFITHGMAVASAALFGNIASYSSTDLLPTPRIKVDSFRVFPQSSSDDYDLYEAIDIIEEVVPRRTDIQVFNLSIGPYGAIDDDDISRFTYAIDELSKNGDKLFVVAVGNDGDLGDDGLCRIQAPSDAVNCLGVGACVQGRDGSVERANYSSYGDGREGCKVKPDVVAFGGDERMPFHLIAQSEDTRFFSCGTSFSAPVVASKAAEIIGRCKVADPLLARALLIHTAEHPSKEADRYLGHGCVKTNVDEILDCSKNRVTVIFQSKISPKKSVKIPLPFLCDLDMKGKVTVEWTIALATPVDAKHTEDYTQACVEDTFYPHAYKYKMTKEIDNRPKTKTAIIKDFSTRQEWVSEGWNVPNGPISYSDFDNKYKPEQERKSNFKWDTVVNRKATFKYDSMNDPYLLIHAMDRNGLEADFVNYAVVVSIEYFGDVEDIYELTLDMYDMLEAAEIRTEAEILVRH